MLLNNHAPAPFKTCAGVQHNGMNHVSDICFNSYFTMWSCVQSFVSVWEKHAFLVLTVTNAAVKPCSKKVP